MTAESLALNVLPSMPEGMTRDAYAPATSLEVFNTLDALTPFVQAAKPALHEAGVKPLPLIEIPTETQHTVLAYDAASAYPGGAFKFAGALFGLMLLKQDNPDLQRVTTGSAGNFAATLQKAGEILGVQVTAHTPSHITPQRMSALRSAGIDVIHEDYADVVAATAGARSDAGQDPGRTTFLHAYNDPFVIRGQAITAEYLLGELRMYAARNKIDLTSYPTELLAQVGGGSWITGLAVEVEKIRRNGYFDKNVKVRRVRPVKKNNKLDPRYPGLAVSEPGSWAKPVIDDWRFVQQHCKIRPRQTGHALVHLASVLGESVHEPSGVAGLAAALSLSQTTEQPTLYVTMLSGRNDSQTTQAMIENWHNANEWAEARPDPDQPPRTKSPTRPPVATQLAGPPRPPAKKPSQPQPRTVTPRPATPQERPAPAVPSRQVETPSASKPTPAPTNRRRERTSTAPKTTQSDPKPSPKPEKKDGEETKRTIKNPGLSGPTADFRRGISDRNGQPYKPNTEHDPQPKPERRRKTPF